MNPTPLWWTIRHRIVTLAFLLGLFHRLREMMSNSSFNSFHDLASCLKPHSEWKAEFFKDVIMYANRFMATHQSQFDLWQSRHTPSEENPSSHNSHEKHFRLPNKLLAERLANLAKDEISKYFLTLQGLKAFDRGEVTGECSYATHCLDGSTPQTPKILH